MVMLEKCNATAHKVRRNVLNGKFDYLIYLHSNLLNVLQDRDSNLWLLYTDNDMVSTNKLEFSILNDTLGIFRLKAVQFPNEDGNPPNSTLTNIRK